MSLLTGSILAAGLLLGGIAALLLAGVLRDRHEERAATADYGRPRYRLAVPCTDAVLPRHAAAGGPPWADAPAPRKVLRTGPLTPGLPHPRLATTDVPVPEEVMPSDSARSLLPHMHEPNLSARVTGASAPHPDVPVPAWAPVLTGTAPGGSHHASVAAPRTLSHVPGPAVPRVLPAGPGTTSLRGAADGRTTATLRPQGQPPAAGDTGTLTPIRDLPEWPEWAQWMATCPLEDLAAVVARDQAHCHALEDA